MVYERLFWVLIVFTLCFFGGLCLNFISNAVDILYKREIEKKKKRYIKYGIKYYKSDLEKIIDG